MASGMWLMRNFLKRKESKILDRMNKLGMKVVFFKKQSEFTEIFS